MQSTRLVITLFFVGLCGCSADPLTTTNHPKIIGGEVANPGSPIEESSVVLLNNRSGSQYKVICSGVLIDNMWVLTARHCERSAGGPTHVAVGRDSANPLDRQKVASFHRHPNNDVGLIKLSNPLNGTPVSIRKDLPTAGQTLYVTGYGSTSTAEAMAPPPNQAYLKMITSTFVRANPSRNEFEDKFEGANGTCIGDSGGPAYTWENDQLWLIGITSRGGSAGKMCGYDATYTDATKVTKWIEDTKATGTGA